MSITPELIEEWTRNAPATGPERDMLIARRAIDHSADASKMVAPTLAPAGKESLIDAPAGSLVERVALRIAPPGSFAPCESYDSEARAAIREVAAWLKENRCPNTGTLLEKEANRG
jgi:hypothetical protein